MITKVDLIKKISIKFPRMRKPEDYADLILKGVKLQAFDPKSSRRQKDFVSSGNVKVHVFNNSYRKLDLLIPIKEADRLIVVVSRRAGLFLFNFSRAIEILNLEKDMLFKHINSEPSIKIHVTNALKLVSTSSIDSIKKRMDTGDLFKQAGAYDKVFTNLTKNGVKPRGYMWFGVRTIPISHYYLSNESKTLLR